jgi:hypothetical protein
VLHRLLLLIISISTGAAFAAPTLEQGYRQMYNLQFADAHRTFQEWQQQHPDDPVGAVSDAAAYLFSEFDRLHILQSEFFTHEQHFITDRKLTPDPALKIKFLAALEKTRAIAARKPNDHDAMFATILANGLESDYIGLIEKRYGASFQKMKAGRQAAERLLQVDPTYYDAWVAVGVENYMLSTKAAPVRWLLRLGGGQTSKTEGVEKLKLVAEKGHFLAPFARLLLAVVDLRDNNVAHAREILTSLSKEFPGNPLYRQELDRISTPASPQRSR